MQLLIVQYWAWYVKVRYRHISHLDVQCMNTQTPKYILENKRQQSVNDICSCIFTNIGGAWSQTFIKKYMTAFIGIFLWDILATSSTTVTTYFFYRATTKYSWAFYSIITVKMIYIDNNCQHRAVINHDGRPTMVDTLLTLILKMGQEAFHFHFCL